MKLLTKELEKRFASVGSQSEVDDPIVIARFFSGCVPTWLATEYNPETKVFYGKVMLYQDIGFEWGNFPLYELERQTFPPFGLGVERDLYIDEKPASKY